MLTQVPTEAPAARGPARDLTVALAASAPTPHAAPEGELIAALGDPGRGYAVTREEDLVRLRFAGLCDVVYARSTATATVRPDPALTPDHVGALVTANLIALLLGLKGVCALHASAVEVDGACVAFPGGTGAGKSTVAALLALNGCPLVTDDLLRVDPPATAHRGGTEVRLRPSTPDLPGAGSARRTGDGRTAVRPRLTTSEALPVGLVAFPVWLRAGEAVQPVALGRRETLERLLSFPRVLGWTVPEPLRTHFDACAELAGSVRGIELRIPRGAPLTASLAEEIRAALRAHLA